jgi:hypothetical protein
VRDHAGWSTGRTQAVWRGADEAKLLFRIDNRTPNRRFGLIASSYDRNVICEMAERFPGRDAAMVFVAGDLGTICLTGWPQATDRVLLPSGCPS